MVNSPLHSLFSSTLSFNGICFCFLVDYTTHPPLTRSSMILHLLPPIYKKVALNILAPIESNIWSYYHVQCEWKKLAILTKTCNLAPPLVSLQLGVYVCAEDLGTQCHEKFVSAYKTTKSAYLLSYKIVKPFWKVMHKRKQGQHFPEAA